MKNIIIVGYPKSGCTWATRLVAELIGCPVAGFWKSERSEIAVEGAERISEFRCYKAHHQLEELQLDSDDSDTRIIYVLRDPRDVAVSAASHFEFVRFPRISRFFHSFRRGEKLYRHTLYPVLVGQHFRLAKMTEALLHGSMDVHQWCRVSWKEHWRAYHQAGVPMVRYEDLLTRPEDESARMLRALGIERSAAAIAVAVKNQSFARKKAALLRQGETGRAKFLRVGQTGQWRAQLPPDLQTKFVEALRDELRAWNYPA